eukprot:tig00000553_g2074.t1
MGNQHGGSKQKDAEALQRELAAAGPDAAALLKCWPGEKDIERAEFERAFALPPAVAGPLFAAFVAQEQRHAASEKHKSSKHAHAREPRLSAAGFVRGVIAGARGGLDERIAVLEAAAPAEPARRAFAEAALAAVFERAQRRLGERAAAIEKAVAEEAARARAAAEEAARAKAERAAAKAAEEAARGGGAGAAADEADAPLSVQKGTILVTDKSESAEDKERERLDMRAGEAAARPAVLRGVLAEGAPGGLVALVERWEWAAAARALPAFRHLLAQLAAAAGWLPLAPAAPQPLPLMCSAGGRPALLPREAVWALCGALPRPLTERWDLVYSSSRDGQAFSRFAARAFGRGPCIVAVKDDGGHVFGGFVPESLRKDNKWYGSGEAFLFQAAPRLALYPSTGVNANFVYANSQQMTLPNGFGMGGQFGFWGLFLDGDLEGGESRGPNTTFGVPAAGLAHGATFKVASVEVWAVDLERAAAEAGGEGAGGPSALAANAAEKARPPPNIAQNKPTEASSYYRCHGCPLPPLKSHFAVDGNTGGNVGRDKMFHSGTRDHNPWWKVKLLGKYAIDEIKIFNRTDCCTDRHSNITIDILKDGKVVKHQKYHGKAPTAKVPAGIHAGQEYTVYAATGTVGDEIKISRSGEPLQLAEVQLYGKPYVAPPPPPPKPYVPPEDQEDEEDLGNCMKELADDGSHDLLGAAEDGAGGYDAGAVGLAEGHQQHIL